MKANKWQLIATKEQIEALNSLAMGFFDLFSSALRYVNNTWGVALAQKKDIWHFWKQSRIARNLPDELVEIWLKSFYTLYTRKVFELGTRIPHMAVEVQKLACCIPCKFLRDNFAGVEWETRVPHATRCMLFVNPYASTLNVRIGHNVLRSELCITKDELGIKLQKVENEGRVHA